MISGKKRNELKKQAIGLRCLGDSYPMIEKKLGVSRSTLSAWFRNLELPNSAQSMILKRKQDHIKSARELSALKNKGLTTQKRGIAREKVKIDLASIPFTCFIKEALLAMLYLGEGFKKKSEIGLANSNSKILCAYVKLVQEVYGLPAHRLVCTVFLRADQDSETEKKFWSTTLDIPLAQFRKTQIDKRTVGKKTWEGYHGVCAVRCYDANLEKRLTAWQELLLEKIITGL